MWRSTEGNSGKGGTIGDDSNFIVNHNCGTFIANLPKYGSAPKDATEKALWQTLVANIFSVGAVPDPSDPTKTIAVAAKKDRADCKICDIDVVMAHVYEELAGTVVPYAGAI